MSYRLAIIMDPIEECKFETDTSLHFMLKAQELGWEVFYLQQKDLFLKESEVFAKVFPVKLYENPTHFFDKAPAVILPLKQMNMVMMRTDPPVHQLYIYTSYLLEMVEREGVLVVNRASAFRNFNEKMMINFFPDLIAPTLVTSQIEVIQEFIKEQKEVVIKPLDGMRGKNVFFMREHDTNNSAIMEMMTDNGNNMVMVQRFIPEVKEGDKRIFLVNGEPLPKMVVRTPKQNEIRGNLGAGGIASVAELSEHDRKICKRISGFLQKNGMYFVGIDVLGNYLSEINITSPTTLRLLERMDPTCHYSGEILQQLASLHPLS